MLTDKTSEGEAYYRAYVALQVELHQLLEYYVVTLYVVRGYIVSVGSGARQNN